MSLKQLSSDSGWSQDLLLKQIVKDFSGKKFTVSDLKENPKVSSFLPQDTKKDTKTDTKKDSPSRSEKANQPINPDKCQCRIWNGGYGKQCSGKKHENTEICNAHTAKPAGLGLITEPRPSIHDPEKDRCYVIGRDGKKNYWADPNKSSKKKKSKSSETKVVKIVPELPIVEQEPVEQEQEPVEQEQEQEPVEQEQEQEPVEQEQEQEQEPDEQDPVEQEQEQDSSSELNVDTNQYVESVTVPEDDVHDSGDETDEPDDGEGVGFTGFNIQSDNDLSLIHI